MSERTAGGQGGTVTLRLLPGGGEGEADGEQAPVVPIDWRLRLARRIHPSAAEVWELEDDRDA